MVSMYVSVIQISMVHASPGVVALTVNTVPACYQLVQTVLKTGAKRLCHVFLCLCKNACERSPALCRESRASCPVIISTSVCPHNRHVLNMDVKVI